MQRAEAGTCRAALFGTSPPIQESAAALRDHCGLDTPCRTARRMPTLSSPVHRPFCRWGSGLSAAALLALSVGGLI
ncbi:MAG TPA: hypothetical protein PKC59_05060 [Burkholderiaceae bacterium]|nr:hypothetical protein [Burkholderiaceae bacterium]HNB44163.1 hypothetical protein [Burkholderiaceae bacterium]HNG78467.1 hypothetical protein [Burkholderiaceae bacterium]